MIDIIVRRDVFTKVIGYNKTCKICGKSCPSKGWQVLGNETFTLPDSAMSHYFQVHYGFVCSKKCTNMLVLQSI